MASARDLDLKTLRLFVQVCEARSLKLAAAQAHIEPSAVSKRLAQLEADLGCSLLRRSRQGSLPSPAGLALLEHARGLLYAQDRVLADMAAFAGGLRGHVRLVASASAIAEHLLDDIAAFLRVPAHQGIQVDIDEHLSVEVVRRVRDGSASLGLCWDQVAMDGLVSVPYRPDHLALVVHAGHRLARRKRLRLADTLDEEHVVQPPATAVSQQLARAAALAGKALRHRIVVSNFDAALRVVRARLAVSVIPLQVCQSWLQSGELVAVPLDDAWARRRFAICLRQRDSLSAPALRLLSFLSERAAAS